jgi:hypothetical protein
MLVIDELGVCGREPNVNVCVQADEQKFKAMVFGCL